MENKHVSSTWYALALDLISLNSHCNFQGRYVYFAHIEKENTEACQG